ncbi:hypothetical protein Daus18300_005143 [Diaporthe australafricana]|uniref:BZIP domain-containing protein n=1 Tax=Diaporthe australafricana TaxID=127596 RepID=A0ABR3X3E6_9PEZI
MKPDTTVGGGGKTARQSPSATKRNSAVRKEQNRNASRTYRERRKQRLALLDRFLEKDQDQGLPASSQETTLTEPTLSDLENAQTVPNLRPSSDQSATPPAQLLSSEPLGEGIEVVDSSTFNGLSFDDPWPVSSNDPVWDFVVEQDGTSGSAHPETDLPTIARSPASILGYAGKDTNTSNEEASEPMQRSQAWQSSVSLTLSPADVFFATPGQQSTSLPDSTSNLDSGNGKVVVSETASLASSSGLSRTLALSARSACTNSSPLPGEESLGEFMNHLMSLRLPDVKRTIYVQQNGLFAAVMDNTLAIGVLAGVQAVFDDDANSPFTRDWIDSKGSVELAQIRSKFSAAPRDLQPVDVQITVEHHVYLDVIPFPSFRERALKALAHDPPLFDEEEMCVDICTNEGLIVWGSQGNDQGMDACRPWDMRSWEPKTWFLRKYPFLTGGWEDEMWRAARWWHMMRGERIASGPASPSVAT